MSGAPALGQLARLGIAALEHLERGSVALRHTIKTVAYQLGDVREANVTAEETADGHLIGSIEDTRRGAPLLDGAVRKVNAGEGIPSGTLKGEAAQLLDRRQIRQAAESVGKE